MSRNLILPAIAVIAFTFMIWHLLETHQPVPDVEPPVAPSRTPYTQTIAGAGLVEPRSENVHVAAIVPGIVTEVHVHVGQKVVEGALLFTLDDRQRRADLAVQRAQLAEAEAGLHRATHSPRAEDLPPSAARVAKAAADVSAQKDLLDRAEELVAKKIWTEQERFQREQAYLAAKATLAQTVAEDAKLRAGTWAEDIAVARAQVERAKQLVLQAEIELERLRVCAPITGTVLKLDVRPGEYIGTPPGQTLLVLGDVEQLHVRVDIDEQDLPRFRPGLSGTGYVRGDASTAITLKFVRVEPFAEPKRSLTNAGNERVDTRVLQVIYALEAPPTTVYVGQQLDVFLDARPTSSLPAEHSTP